jgi:hypothetical protein
VPDPVTFSKREHPGWLSPSSPRPLGIDC